MSASIQLSGRQTIQEAEQTKRILLESLAESEALTLDCSAVDEVDLTFIQLIMALRKSAEHSGKALSLVTEADSAVLRALDEAGVWPEPGQRFWFERRNPS